MTEYETFLAGKLPKPVSVGPEPVETSPELLPHAAAIAHWAIRRGRAAIFADTGLTKTRMQVEWLRQIMQLREVDMGLIFAPLAVAEQTIAEAAIMGVDLQFAESQPAEKGMYITNYGKMHRFEAAGFGALVLDESSILKSITGKTREKLINDWQVPDYRLACTATPAPNDMAEIANHAEFLGVMTRRDMLARFFVHDDDGWRLKGHARTAFFQWMATWAVYIRRPSDLGFSDRKFKLPALHIQESRVSVDAEPANGFLFPTMAAGITGRRLARRASLSDRVVRAAQIINETEGQFLIWCGLNDEANDLTKALTDIGISAVNIEGATPDDTKLDYERRWRAGDIRCLCTKSKIFGWGMNWQHCHNMLFLGLSDSWEEYYQDIRRCYRFGQKNPVNVWIVLSDAEGPIMENVMAKEEEAQTTAEEVIKAMGEIERHEVLGQVPEHKSEYVTNEDSGDGWRLLLGDSCERLAELDENSVSLSVHSPPFAQLYVYSASERDMGNCADYGDFFTHYRYVAEELLRVTQPGRRACVHVQQIAMTQVMQGVIAWRDFRAEVVKLYIEAGWLYHGEVVIDKDPQAQAIRTKSKTLLFVQKNKDSSWSIPAMADYILLFRKPGENAVAIKNDVSNEEWIRWARPIWYSIRESETLQAATARAQADEKHIAPLQLETVERCIRLWSNKGEVVLDPCAGIGTTGYVALEFGRHFTGIELKPEYWAQACKNLREAELKAKSGTLFDLIDQADAAEAAAST